MKKYLIITTALTTICFAPEIMAQCTENTDCASLGYTETSCPDGGLKCPLGNYWYCPGEQCSDDYQYTCTGSNEAGGSGEACGGKYKSCTCADGYEWKNGTCQEILKPEWGKCNGSAKNCNIGDIVYSDGTCSPQKISDKTPIAVVVYKSSDGNCAQAMALNSLGEYAWGISSGIKDISALQNFPSPQDASQDFASCENTIIITSELPSKGNYPAAWETYEYETEGTKAGDWCLPAAGIMTSIKNNWGNISKGFSFAGGEQPNNEYWTSTESGSSYAYISMGNQSNYDYGTDSRPKESLNGVRPVIEF